MEWVMYFFSKEVHEWVKYLFENFKSNLIYFVYILN